MNKTFKQIGTGLCLLGLAAVSFAGIGNGYTGAPAPSIWTGAITAATPTVVLTNNVEVVQVNLFTGSGVNSSLVSFFDCNTTNAPYYGSNYVTSTSYTNRIGYTTNVVTSYVGYNGYTNYYTNSYYWYAANGVAASTNALAPQGVLYAVSGTVGTYNNIMMFNQGVSIFSSSNVTAVIYYIPNK